MSNGGFPAPLLVPGDQGDSVRELQDRLKQVGYYSGPSDGIYGQQTADAVLQFQLDGWLQNLNATGMLDYDTWNILVSVTTSPAGAPTYTAEILRPGEAQAPQAEAEIPVPEILRPGEAQTPVPEAQAVVPEILRGGEAEAPVPEASGAVPEILRGGEQPAAPPVTVSPLPAAPAPPQPRSSGTLGSIQQLAQQIADRVGVDALLVLSVIGAESSFIPTQHNYLTGAKGLMQLTPIAILDLSQRFSVQVTDPYDPAQNILGGTVLLKALLAQFGNDVAKAVAAFHAGASRVVSWVSKMGSNWLSAAGSATRSYVQKVLNTWQAARGGGGATVVATAYTEEAPGGFPSLFEPELQTITETVQNVEIPGVPAVAGISPVLLLVGLALGGALLAEGAARAAPALVPREASTASE